jgi:hypothetical protein
VAAALGGAGYRITTTDLGRNGFGFIVVKPLVQKKSHIGKAITHAEQKFVAA